MRTELVKAFATIAMAMQPMWFTEKQDVFGSDFDHWRIVNLNKSTKLSNLCGFAEEIGQDFNLKGNFLVIQTPTSMKAQQVFENPDLVVSEDCVIYALDENSKITKA